MKKSVITLLIFLIMIISVSAVSAADDVADLGASDDTVVSVANTDTAVTVDDNAKNFTDLNADVAGTSGDIDLGSDYIRNSTSEHSVTISESKLIDGDGHIIDANGSGTIFIIRADITVTLQNVILKNTDTRAIVNYGNLILENVTFINCSDASISSERYSNLDVTGCTFEDYGINFKGVELSLSGNSFNNASKAFVTLALGTLTTPSTIYSSGYNTENWKEVNYVAKAKDDNGNLIAIADDNSWTVKIGDADVASPTVVDGALNGTAEATAYGSQQVTAGNIHLTNPTIDASNVTITPAEKVSEIGYKFSNESALQYGDNFNITVELTNLYNDFGTFNATGTFTVLVNTVEYATLDVNATTGKAIFEFTNIARNNYDITIRYNGDDVYLPNQTSYPTFTVGAKNVEPEVNVTIAEDGTQTVDIIFPSDATGTVTGNVTKGNEVKYTIPTEALSEGKYSFNPELVADTYNLKINFTSTNQNYASYSGTKQFNISKLNTTVDISVENTTYGNNVTITFTLASGVHNATYTINDGTADVYTGTVNLTNGSYPLELDVPAAGVYTITVTSADEKYNTESNTTTFKVAPADTTITMVIGEVALFEDVEVNVTVKFGDKNGTGKVTLYVNDNPVVVDEEELDENGTATLTIAADKIKAGENTIVAEFTSTNGNYSANSTSQTINVAKVTPTITITVNNVKIGEPAYLAITVQDGATTKPTGFITVKLGDKTYPTVPLTDGATQVTIPAADINEVAEYSVEVTYDPNGDVNYNANSTVFKFNVSYYDMEITVSDIANKTVGNNITFTIKAKGDKEFSQNFTVTIKDANGETVDTLSIALDKGVTGKEVQFNLTKGVYTAVISYPGDENYAANSTTTDKFSVAGIIENLTIEIAEVTDPNNATAVVNASVDGD